MVIETIVHVCCECGKRGVLKPHRGYTEEQKKQILAAHYERPSMRGIERIFGVSRHTLAVWLEKKTTQTRP